MAATADAVQTPMGYRATWADGGKTLVIHDVQIFCECFREPPEGAERFDGNYDATWIRRAIAGGLHAKLERNYMPPLHVWHHYDKKEPIAAGHFCLTKAEPMRMQGTQRLAMLADLYVTNPTIQQEILAGRLPYRSVEILNVDKAPKIDSLALLDHETPFLELPMLMVSEVGGMSNLPDGVPADTFAAPWRLEGRVDRSPVVACFRRGRTATLLFQDSPMADDDEDKKPDDEEPKDKENPNPEDDEKSEEMQAEDDTMAQDAAIEKICQALKDGTISAKNLARLQGDIAGLETATAPDMTPSAPGGEAMKAAPSADVLDAKTQARLDAMEAKMREQERQHKRKDAVGAAMKRLESRPLGALDALERKLGAYYDKGEEILKMYVDDVEATVPPSLSRRDTPERFTQDALSPVVMRYQEVAPDAVDKAARFSAEWQELNRNGWQRSSEESYVAFHMGRLGIRLQPKAG